MGGNNTNSTAAVERTAEFWVIHILPVVIFVLGLFGNVMSIVVFTAKKYLTTSSTYYYMNLLAYSDVTVMVILMVRFLNSLPDR